MARPKRNTEYETRIVEPKFAEPKGPGWKKSGIVIKTMYHAYGFPGRIGDVVEVNPEYYDELVKKEFIKPV